LKWSRWRICRLAGIDTAKNNWWTYIIPADLRVILSPFDMDVGVLIYNGGVGAMYFNNDDPPSDAFNNSNKEEGWTTIFPVGGGFEVALSEQSPWIFQVVTHLLCLTI